MHERYDIVVIGAGVAGAAFAGGVARHGRVLLVERSPWPREKVCGCCLNGAAVGSLARLGLAGKLERNGVALERVTVRARGRCAEFARGGSVAISRRVLDGLLVDRAVAAGVEFRPGTGAAVVGIEADGSRLVRLRCGERESTVSAGLVVAADGLSGGSLDGVEGFGVRVSRGSWFGVGGMVVGPGRGTPPGLVEMNVGLHGYVGLVRLDAATVNLGAALDPVLTKVVGGPVAAVAEILKEAGTRPVDVDGLVLRGTGLLTRQRRRVSAPGLLVIGDAAGYVEPFTGEGMAWGLAGAEAASGMVNAGMCGAPLAAEWSRWHASRVRARQRACAVVRGVLRRPRLVGAALAVMSSVPAAARAAGAVARRIERPYGSAAGASA
jgi:flavin-dependent dehydrogenase